MEARRRRDSDEGRYVFEERRALARRTGAFDAMAFARRALSILAPPGMTIALYEGRFDLRVERGRNWGEGRGATWAMVAIPPGTSRESIAVALAELAGVAHVPFIIDTLLSAATVD